MDPNLVVVTELLTAPSPGTGDCTMVQRFNREEGIPPVPGKISLFCGICSGRGGKEKERSECCPKEEVGQETSEILVFSDHS